MAAVPRPGSEQPVQLLPPPAACTRIVGEINASNTLARRYFFWMGFQELSRAHAHAHDPATGRDLSLIHVARELGAS